MKNKDLYSFKKGLDKSKFSHPRITYAIMKNKRTVLDVIKDIEKTREPDDEYKKFDSERVILSEHHAKKDRNGQPVLRPFKDITGNDSNIYDILGMNDPKSDFRKEYGRLEKKYKDVVERHKDKIKKFEQFMEDEADYSPYMIDFELLEQHEECPQDVMDGIHWMINEPKT